MEGETTTMLLMFACGLDHLLSHLLALSQARWRVCEIGHHLPLSFFFFFFCIAAGNRPLRLCETLHLVREEILLRPLYDPQPCVFFFFFYWGQRQLWGLPAYHLHPPFLLLPPPCSLCFSNHAADVPDG